MKIIFLTKIGVASIFGFILLLGCKRHECGHQKEPSIHLYLTDSLVNSYRNQADYIIDTVFDESFGLEDGVRQENLSSHIQLPINLNANRVDYVFRTGTIYDTVTIHYQLDFSYSKRCDWTVSVDSLVVQSTFGTEY